MKSVALALISSVVVLSPLADAQSSRNAALLGRFDPGSSYSDIWGYAAPNGKEYALLGERAGVYVVDCTDPSNPTQRGFFPSAASSARDIKTYRHYAYATSEDSGGTQIIDLSNPDSPRLVKTWGQAFWSNAHNVAIDTQTGTLYPCGTNVGMVVVDLSQDPENPRRITSYGSNYVHDLHIQDGVAYLCEIFSGRFRAMDVSNLPALSTLSTGTVTVCHNSWASRDNQILALTSETAGPGMTIFDISNVRNPRQISTWRTTAAAMIHNVFLRDRVAYISYYGDGFHAVDCSDGANPRQVAFYDTSAAWGVYPFQPSGTMYVSDMSRGLHVISTRASTRLYGAATAAGQGAAPSIHTFGAAYAGNSNFKLEIEGLRANVTATLLLGVGQANLHPGGLSIAIDPTGPMLAASGTTYATGAAAISIPIASSAPSLKLYAQFVATDPAGPLGLVASRGLEFEIFSP